MVQSSVQLLQGGTPVAGTGTLVNAQTLTFTPTSQLSPSTTYTVKVSGFADANGNTVTPPHDLYHRQPFGTVDSILHEHQYREQCDGDYNTQQIILTFSQILDPATVNSSTLMVMNGWNSNYGHAGTYSVNGNQVTFTPANPYPAGAEIYVGECGGPTECWASVPTAIAIASNCVFLRPRAPQHEPLTGSR